MPKLTELSDSTSLTDTDYLYVVDTAETPQSYRATIAAVLSLVDTDSLVATDPALSARNTIQPSSAAVIPLTIRGAASQTANLVETQTSAGDKRVVVSAAGVIELWGTTTTSNRQIGAITPTFSSSTDATRAGRIQMSVHNASTSNTFLSAGWSGANSTLTLAASNIGLIGSVLVTGSQRWANGVSYTSYSFGNDTNARYSLVGGDGGEAQSPMVIASSSGDWYTYAQVDALNLATINHYDGESTDRLVITASGNDSSAGKALVKILNSGFRLASMADADAANETLYYSTTAAKPAYKDASGVVNTLY